MVEEWNNNKRTKKGSISMNEVRKVDIRDSVKTVTSNNFISAKGLETLSLKARKMLYIAISQCRMTDETFFIRFPQKNLLKSWKYLHRQYMRKLIK